jgi:hypothetical protein
VMEEIDSRQSVKEMNTMIKNRVFFVPIRQGWLARSWPELKHHLQRFCLPGPVDTPFPSPRPFVDVS